jgi:hypothetical protein
MQTFKAMSKTPILDIIELPRLTLKEIDISNNVESLVEIFNYNMNQLLDHHQTILDFSLDGVIFPTPIPGLSIKGDNGENGHSIYPAPTPLIDGSVAPISYSLGDMYLDPNGSIFVIKIHANGVDKIYSYSHSIISMLSNQYWISQDSVTNIVQKQTFAMWNDAGNDAKGNIGAFSESNGDVKYYRLMVGDYKRNTSISSAGTFTNLIEAKTTNGLVPTDNASDQTISRDFAQIAIKYRKSAILEPILETVYHKFYEPVTGRFEYNISNGASQVSMHTLTASQRYAISAPNHVGSSVNVKGDNFSLFNKDFRIYKSGDDFYVESAVGQTTNTLMLWMNFRAFGSATVGDLTSIGAINGTQGNFSVSVSAPTGNFTNVFASGKVESLIGNFTTINNNTINSVNGNFSGNVVAINGNFSGNVVAVNGNFTTINAVNANISGSLVAGSGSITTLTVQNQTVNGILNTNSVRNLGGTDLIVGGNFNYGWMLTNGMRTTLVNDGFIRDFAYVHTDNNLTSAMIAKWDTKPDWYASTNGANPATSNAGILNIPNLGTSLSIAGQVLSMRDYMGNVISTATIPVSSLKIATLVLTTFLADRHHSVSTGLPSGSTIINVVAMLKAKATGSSTYAIGDTTTAPTPYPRDSGRTAEQGIGVQYNNNNTSVIRVMVTDQVTVIGSYNPASGAICDTLIIDPSKWSIVLTVLYT